MNLNRHKIQCSRFWHSVLLMHYYATHNSVRSSCNWMFVLVLINALCFSRIFIQSTWQHRILPLMAAIFIQDILTYILCYVCMYSCVCVLPIYQAELIVLAKFSSSILQGDFKKKIKYLSSSLNLCSEHSAFHLQAEWHHNQSKWFVFEILSLEKCRPGFNFLAAAALQRRLLLAYLSQIDLPTPWALPCFASSIPTPPQTWVWWTPNVGLVDSCC